MKRYMMAFILSGLFILSTGMDVNVHIPVFQDESEELIPTTDSVSIDDMDPVFYDAEEDEVLEEKTSDNSAKLIIGLVGIVVLLGLGFIFVNRSRSKE